MAVTHSGRAATRAAGGGPEQPDAPARRRKFTLSRATPYLLILPAIIMELLIHVIPMLVGIFMSLIGLTQFYLTNWSAAPWAGTGNYRSALNFHNAVGRSLLHSFWITLAFTVLTIGLSFLFGMATSIVLQRRFRGRGFLRTLFLIPYALPAYAGIITWKFMFQRDNGLVNELIVNNLHLTKNPPFWLIGDHAFVSVVVVSVWQQWPFAFLMTMAGMQAIPDEVYEAAAIDGASMWQQARHITLGLLRPINSVLLLLLFLWTFREFNTPFVLFGPVPPDSADLLTVHIYASSFVNFNFGLGAAISVLLMAFLVIVAGLWAIWNRRVTRYA